VKTSFSFSPISTRRLVLRDLTSADAANLFRYRTDPDIARYQSWIPASVREVDAFIQELGTRGPDSPGHWYQVGITLKDSGTLIGDCGIHTPGDNPRQSEIGITLDKPWQRQGLAQEALGSLLAFLFESLHRHRVYASLDPRNTRSRALLERVGLRKEAHLLEAIRFKGEWADDMIYAMLQREWRRRS
jgi:RimJ/RimL family protein N-acetyltransferase